MASPLLPLLLTSQVSDKVLQHHLAVRLDVGAVHVGVEEDDGEGKNEDGVGVVELLHHLGVAHAIALAVGGTWSGMPSYVLSPQPLIPGSLSSRDWGLLGPVRWFPKGIRSVIVVSFPLAWSSCPLRGRGRCRRRMREKPAVHLGSPALLQPKDLKG